MSSSYGSLWSIVAITLLYFCVSSVLSRPQYQARIPNGDKVQHPCFPSSLWQGVGHLNPVGGGNTNKFGQDFKAAGFTWTVDLCNKDSDGDGMTNGQELGDPNCVWTPGSTPFRLQNISHPGICNPCKASQCDAVNQPFLPGLYEPPEFSCPAAQASGAVLKDYRLNYTLVPSLETTYICQAFYVDPDNASATYYMVANQPFINNTEIMHHALAFGCYSAPPDSQFSAPYECMMADMGCTSLVAAWGFGVSGECLDSATGVKLGAGGFPYLVVQLHWNNHDRASGLYDSSGFRFHLTTTARQFEAGMMIVGQNYLELPPKQPSLTAVGNCTGQATGTLFTLNKVSSIYITMAVVHMHLNGRYGALEQYRNGVKVADILPYQEVLYSNPPILKPNRLEVKAGDMISTVCTYNTMEQTVPLYYGEATQDEMCFGFLRYFPKLQVTSDDCSNYGPYVLIPQLLMSETKFNCTMSTFLGQAQSYWFPKLAAVCSLAVPACIPACRTLVTAMLNDPCMSGWPRKLFAALSKYGGSELGTSIKQILLLISQCEWEMRIENNYVLKSALNSTANSDNSGGFTQSSQLALLIAACVIALVLLLVVAVGLLIRALCASASAPVPVTLSSFPNGNGAANGKGGANGSSSVYNDHYSKTYEPTDGSLSVYRDSSQATYAGP